MLEYSVAIKLLINVIKGYARILFTPNMILINQIYQMLLSTVRLM